MRINLSTKSFLEEALEKTISIGGKRFMISSVNIVNTIWRTLKVFKDDLGVERGFDLKEFTISIHIPAEGTMEFHTIIPISSTEADITEALEVLRYHFKQQYHDTQLKGNHNGSTHENS